MVGWDGGRLWGSGNGVLAHWPHIGLGQHHLAMEGPAGERFKAIEEAQRESQHLVQCEAVSGEAAGVTETFGVSMDGTMVHIVD